ncbi:Protein MEMO1-like [Gracilariopsis chorda]|uniref:Protein MEMO1-like n=1 Tax=Gracilariopsis chorda TaxID=448386 RepID=A0A2V3J0Y1_9FLOR|nr:Protein MEMO1-like [Gracilariopsis chorda]|eukprot:PXF47597.1 Protein MEMO1-like [Gracilariopsis chorda]
MPVRRRRATHAGSWYDASPEKLRKSLTAWLQQPSCTPSSSNRSVTHAVIAPHAGFSYSASTAAHAYAAIDPRKFSRVIVLGPSHHVYMKDTCALSDAHLLETPLGDLPVDRDVVEGLLSSEHRHTRFITMNTYNDEAEHSIEMHLPFIRLVFAARDVNVVPIVVGSLSEEKERAFGSVLSSWIGDGETFFIVSSDFCHWGSRFGYTRVDHQSEHIWQSIEKLDRQGMRCIESGDHASFWAYQRHTENTVCGRHPIGVLMSALAHCSHHSNRVFETRFVRYKQSSRCMSMSDSSVSYASAVIQTTSNDDETGN